MKKICIAGAGPAGLHLASELASAGHEVHVFEMLSREKLAQHHNWPDSVELNMLYWARLPVPQTAGRCFYGDGVKHSLTDDGLYLPKIAENSTLFIPDFSQRLKCFGGLNSAFVDRRALSCWQVRQAEQAGVHLHFGVQVLGLLGQTEGKIKDISVHGIAVQEQGECREYHCDVIVDATGAASALRTQLADERIAAPFTMEQCFDTFRTVRHFSGKQEMPQATGHLPFANCGYMLDGQRGYVWMTFLADDCVDIGCCVVRRTERSQTAEEIVRGVAAQFADRLSDESVWEGGGRIPATDPLPALVADGFAVLGDSAAMANPGNGCGVAGALHAGSMLAKVIHEAPDCTVASLWPYAKQWMQLRGTAYAASLYRGEPLTLEECRFLAEENMLAGTKPAFFGPESFSMLQTAAAQKNPSLTERILLARHRSSVVTQAYATYPSAWNAEEFDRWSAQLCTAQHT